MLPTDRRGIISETSQRQKIKSGLEHINQPKDFPGGSEGKVSAFNAGDLGLIPGWGRSLEKEMATHSSILAWKTPWMEKPGKSQTRLSDFTRTRKGNNIATI